MQFQQELKEYLKTKRAFSTHCHHLSDEAYAGMTLSRILEKSYCGWMDTPPQNAKEAEAYIRKNGCNSYFRWMFAALEELYGLPFLAVNFDELSQRVLKAHEDPAWQMRLMKENCGYDKIMLDYYDHPGSDLGYPELFVPVLRCNMFAVCNARGMYDHNGNNAFEFLGREFDDLEEYLAEIGKRMSRHKAIKFALAYDLDNEVLCFDKQRALAAFLKQDANARQKKDFYDYMVYRICKLAGELGVVVQIHTGLAKLDKSSPLYLKKLIDECPEVKFDLFHGGFPWMDDMLALAHNYPNVWADTCWMPLISTATAKRFLRDALEVGDAHRVLWGCDTWTSEESYGAVLAGRETVSGALADMVADGAISKEYAFYLADRIWHENGMALFSLN